MPAPAEARPVTADTNAVSARGDGTETVAAGRASSVADPTVPGFGPPAAAGEVGTLGPYRLVKELGRGGMGAVYAALDPRLERRLALKVMLPGFATDAAAKERFLREARAAARIKHDNVVTVYEADERDGVPYIAMEFLKGYPLDDYLMKKGNPTVPQVLRIAAEAAAGLAAAHKFGLVHRDIKPANLWLEAPNGRVKVLDFGLAKSVDTKVELTESGAVIGTPAYMSPEQARGQKVDHRTDLFSLGALLYRLCSGRLPFSGPTTMAVLMALATEEPPPVRELNPTVPESLAALTHQLLSKTAAGRPQSAAEVVKRLRAIMEEVAAPRPRVAALSGSKPQVVEPQVVYVPMLVTAAPETNPFAELDSPVTVTAVPDSVAEPTAVPAGKKPGGSWLWTAAGFAALAAVALGGVIIIIRNRDGTETKIEVPDGATVTVKDKGGRTLASVGPGKKNPPTADADRAVAEWVITQGGFARVNGEGIDRRDVAELPEERFTLTVVDLTGTTVSDAGLERLKELKALKGLVLNDTMVSDAGLVHLKEHKALATLNLYGTKVSDAGLAHFKDCKSLMDLGLAYTKVSDAGLAYLTDCKSLTHLCLDGTKVSDAGLAHLKDCRALRHLDLQKTKVTANGLEALHAALPACQIFHDGGTIEPKK